MSQTIMRIAVTPGEPAGIGPDVLIKAVQQPFNDSELVAIANVDLLKARAKTLGLTLTCYPFQADKPQAHRAGTLSVIDVALGASCHPGVLHAGNVPYVLQCLHLANTLCMQRTTTALVTGPVHKGIINSTDIKFSGHTEYLAYLSQAEHTVMLFVYKQKRLALATTHLPLSAVAKAITFDHLQRVIKTLYVGLQSHFKIKKPRLVISGLNPHAGEQGHLGSEEQEVIIPCLRGLRQQNIDVKGPLAADTLFTAQHFATSDAMLVMYHDQGLPAFKQLSFGHAVNMTLGLPYLRTSVDHGTALSLAGHGHADPSSFINALNLARDLNKSHYSSAQSLPL